MTNRIVIDIGNTRISTGAFLEGELVDLAHHLLSNIDSATNYVKGKAACVNTNEVAICSVAPSVAKQIVQNLTAHKFNVYAVNGDEQNLISDTYASLGADRLANIIAGFKLYAKVVPVIVLDFGSATTLSAVSPQGKFLGGMITLGLTNTFHALHQKTEQLPDLAPDPDLPITPLAFSTPEAIESGCILAHVGLIEHWVKCAKGQLGQEAIVVATGGAASTLAPFTEVLDIVEPDLTIFGINFMAEEAAVLRDQD